MLYENKFYIFMLMPHVCLSIWFDLERLHCICKFRATLWLIASSLFKVACILIGHCSAELTNCPMDLPTTRGSHTI